MLQPAPGATAAVTQYWAPAVSSGRDVDRSDSTASGKLAVSAASKDLRPDIARRTSSDHWPTVEHHATLPFGVPA